MEFEEVEQDSDPIFAASIVGTPITSLVPVTDEEWVVHPTIKKPLKVLESDTEEESDDGRVASPTGTTVERIRQIENQIFIWHLSQP
jgi:hypothetical protein